METKQYCLTLALLASGLAQPAQGTYEYYSFPAVDALVAVNRHMVQHMQQTRQMMNSVLQDPFDSSQQSSRMPLTIQEDASTGRVTLSVKNCKTGKHLSFDTNKIKVGLDDGSLTVWLLPTLEGTTLRARLQQEAGNVRAGLWL